MDTRTKEKIFRSWKKGKTIEDLCRENDLSKSTIYRVLNEFSEYRKSKAGLVDTVRHIVNERAKGESYSSIARSLDDECGVDISESSLSRLIKGYLT